MENGEIQKLDKGDQVYWEDPDNGNCSRTITINTIEVKGEIVKITSIDGDELDCFAHELS